MADDPVVAVVWTYGRRRVLEGCLAAIDAQTRPVDRLVVVDSASPDDTVAWVREHRPDVELVALADNEGMGATIGDGIDAALSAGAAHVWLVEDDSRPAPDALARGLDYLGSHPGIDVVGPVGADVRRGRWHWIQGDDREGPVDFCLIDGALARAEVLARVDPPRRDFFIMMIDVDYPLRLARAGARSARCAAMEVAPLRLGATSGDATWRSYYQTRNHLRMALDLRSGWLLWGFLDRTARQLVWAVVRSGRARALVSLRARGIRDALTRRMGRTVEPAGAGPSAVRST